MLEFFNAYEPVIIGFLTLSTVLAVVFVSALR